MARLILKSPYIKSTGGASGYLRYIATRERVELIPDDRPPTRKQEQLIAKLVKDFPDSKVLYEYEDYLTKPTKVNASAFITLALEANWDSIHESEQYMKYIATRPRAERIGAHGLFGDEDAVSLEKAVEELENYTGNVWTHIISLKREDAARLGFDNAAAWRNLIRAHRNDIAAAMKILPGDFRWYAAFHDEGEHPHIHMMAWSVKAGQAYLSKEGIRQIKSKLTNDIFRNEMLHLYEQKSESRDELVRKTRRAMLELVRAMQDGVCDHPDAEQLMLELAAQLVGVKGKKSYGYLPKRLKQLVDEIELLDGAAEEFDLDKVLRGELSPVFFGSALTNFGVEPFLENFLRLTPTPLARVDSLTGEAVDPCRDEFSAFIFKIQANMNKAHRDRIAFMRICSGKFERGMEAFHVQEGKNIKLATGTQLMAQDRAIVDEAYAGDIIGLFDPGIFSIGDTLCTGKKKVQFAGIPTFSPEHFARIEQKDTMKRKQFVKGMEQIAQEGAIQIFREVGGGMEEVVVGVVGVLQLEVLEYRLNTEYNVEIRMQQLPFEQLRWVQNDPDTYNLRDLDLTSDTKAVEDMKGNRLLLFTSDWAVRWAETHNETLKLSEFGNI